MRVAVALLNMVNQQNYIHVKSGYDKLHETMS
jgi:hypothetical protein